jgi:broad specificity phosphatase PhoE
MARIILAIRHAEKPSEDGRVRGVDPAGREDPHSLSTLGWQRAGALVRFLAPADGGMRDPRLARPDALFATRVTHDSPSQRPMQTLVPLAALLGLPIDTAHGRHEIDGLLDAVERAPGVALISWTHRTINRIAERLLGGQDVPGPWPDERFDVVWVFARAGAGWRLAQVPQMLLAGDRAEGIG